MVDQTRETLENGCLGSPVSTAPDLLRTLGKIKIFSRPYHRLIRCRVPSTTSSRWPLASSFPGGVDVG